MPRSVFELRVDALLSPAARQQRLAAFAQKRIDLAAERNKRTLGVETPYTVEVDGVVGRPIASVDPDKGVVVARFDVIDDTLRWIAEKLVQASPVLTGQYSQSHILLADGIAVLPGHKPPPAQSYAFVNTQPYARKIERGLSSQAPAGVYHAVAAMVQKRVGNFAKVRFTFQALHGVSNLDAWAQTTSLTKKGRRRFGGAEREEWLRRQPAIVMDIR